MEFSKSSKNVLACPVMGTIFLVVGGSRLVVGGLVEDIRTESGGMYLKGGRTDLVLFADVDLIRIRELWN